MTAFPLPKRAHSKNEKHLENDQMGGTNNLTSPSMQHQYNNTPGSLQLNMQNFQGP